MRSEQNKTDKTAPRRAVLQLGEGVMKDFKVAMLQILPEATADGNLRKGLDACARAKEMGADLALFPEMWSTGYRIAESLPELQADAVRADVLLSLPIKWVCREECRGLCPKCGANLNQGDCGCTFREEDPRLAALRKLLEE